MTTVVRNKGASFGLPHKFFGEDPEKGSGIFSDFINTAEGGFVLTGSPGLAARTHGTALLLDAADEIESGAMFSPADANVSFAGASRTKIVFGAEDTTLQNIMFATDSTASPTEKLGFQLATSGDGTDSAPVEAVTVTCQFADGSVDSSVALSSTDLPDGFEATAYHTYAVLCEPRDGGGVVVSYFIDEKLVKEISQADTSNWAGLAWVQTNLTSTSTHDQAIDWISLGTNLGYV